MAGLSCDGVGVAADGRVLLDGVTLAVDPGAACAVMGRSGAGKSTLLKAIAGLVGRGGTISVDGRDLTGVAPHRRRVGLLFQHPRVFPTMRAVDNVAYPLRLARWPRGRRRAEAVRLLAEVGLADRAQAWPGELSGGEQQRVALARALCVPPAVLLLDEPLTGLDRLQRRELVGLLQRVRAERHVTWVIVTHDPDDAAALGDTIAVLDAGRLVQHAPAGEVRSCPASDRVAALFGSVDPTGGAR
ncbi:MAG: ABC transporter ATP-binding protein [Acidimicrobiia bacterium]|nr:ABC transporter ATP-binding protein [Acidimicrobiia bacterium]MDH4363438.1 ABC transporter ATP-binding protein [Acidimicrobiia bacterium]